MAGVCNCPMVGGRCGKEEPEIKIQPGTFFLAEPFNPPKERERREETIKLVLDSDKSGRYCKENLRLADKEPKDAIFCDICRMIQSSAYGIVDISGLNPNVLLELGMLLGLGKPVTVIFKKTEEKRLRDNLPSDIMWKRVIPYEEFIDIKAELSKQIFSIPETPPVISPVEAVSQAIAEKDPELAKRLEDSMQETLNASIKELKKLMEKSHLAGGISTHKKEINPFDRKQINEIVDKVKLLQRLIGYPRDSLSSLLKGNLLANQGDYEKAVEIYDWALNFEPDNINVLYNKGIALSILGRETEAKDCFERVIKSKQVDPANLSKNGNSLTRLGKREEAIMLNEQATNVIIDEYELWFNKGNSFNMLCKFEEAIKCYNKAIDLNPGTYGVWCNKGFSLWKLCRDEEAILCYDKAISLNKEKYEAWRNKGSALKRLGLYEKAIECYDHAVKINREDPEAWFDYGTSFKRLERYEEAIKCYNHSIKLMPKRLDAWCNKGVSLDRLKRFEEAIECYRDALKIDSKDKSIMINLSEELIVVQKTDEGLKLATKTLSISKNQEITTIALLLSCLAQALLGKEKEFTATSKKLMNRRNKKHLQLTEDYDFNNLEKIIAERLSDDKKTTMLLLVSRFKGAEKTLDKQS